MRLRSLRTAAVFVVFALLAVACSGTTSLEAPASDGPYDIKVVVDPPQMQEGQKATFNYQFLDRSNNRPVTELPETWTKPVHVVMVNRELNWFQHSYTSAPTGGWFPVQVWFANAGHYTLWAEYADPAGGEEPLHYHHAVSFGPGAFEHVEEGPAPLNESTTLEKLVSGINVRLETEHMVHGEHAEFRYTLTDRGNEITNLSPYLGAAGHLYIISADSEEFHHAVALQDVGGLNEPSEPTEGGGVGATGGGPQVGQTPESGEEGSQPEETPVQGQGTPVQGELPEPTVLPDESEQGGENGSEQTGTLGPEITFEHEFEEAGLYKVWAQFLYEGRVITADFVVRVD